jgi:hypothetical protein
VTVALNFEFTGGGGGTVLRGPLVTPRYAPDRRRVDPLAQSGIALRSAIAAPFALRDWPLPRTTSQPTQTWLQTVVSGTLAPPLRQTDWPPSRAPSFALRTWTQSPAVPTAVSAVPFSQLNWPTPRNPVVPRAARVHRSSAGTTAPPAGVPFSQTDWPKPLGPGSGQGQHVVSLLALAVGAPFFQADWPLARGSDARRIDLYAQISLVLRGQIVPAPFAQQDWPNPRSYPFVLRSWVQNLVESTLPAPVGSPFFQHDWPNPRPNALGRAWERSFTLSLIGLDQFFGAPGQPPAYAWPLPRTVGPSVDLRNWSQSHFQGVPVVTATPFAKSDWPLARVPVYVPSLRAWVQFAQPTAAVQSPFVQSDWPIPRNPIVPRPARAHRASAGTTAPPVGTPFSQTDWPRPLAPNAGQGQHIVSLLALAVGSPFVQSDWPISRLPAFADKWQWGYSSTFRLLVPFAQRDWPTPKTVPPVVRSWTRHQFRGVDTFFTSPGRGPTYDWPNPRAPIYPASTRTWSQSRFTTKLASQNAVVVATVQRRSRTATAGERKLVAETHPRTRIATARERIRTATALSRNRVITFIPNRSMSQAFDLSPPIDADGEEETVGFDFGPALATGVTLTGTPTITCFVSDISQVPDPNAMTRILSVPTLVASKRTGAPNAQWNILFGDVVAGVVYVLQCLAPTSDGQKLSDWVRFPSDQPS